MKLWTALVLAVGALALGAADAGAYPDGYQPCGAYPDGCPGSLSDAVDRHVANVNATNVTGGAAAHPDSRAERPRFRPDGHTVGNGGSDWTAWLAGAIGGALLAILAVVGAPAIRERRRLVLR